MTKTIAKLLRRWADKLDPPQKGQRHHPALKNPGELKNIPTETDITKPQEKLPRATRVYLPGEWGGPYI